MLDINITTAVITAFASLLVATISLIAVIINNRQAARSAKELESIKYRYSQADSTESFSDEYLNASLNASKIALQSIQRVKDEMQLILSSIETSLDTETALQRIKTVREDLFASYEQYMAELDDTDAGAFHHAKNQALKVENFLQINLAGKEFVSLLTPEQKTTLRELRNELTDIQYTLRDRRSERLLQRIAQHEKQGP